MEFFKSCQTELSIKKNTKKGFQIRFLGKMFAESSPVMTDSTDIETSDVNVTTEK